MRILHLLRKRDVRRFVPLVAATALVAGALGSVSAGPHRLALPLTAAATPGQWTNVTPSNINISSDLPCGNFGITSVIVDPLRASDFYVEANCQGIWKSTDFGLTWAGPINTGTGGSSVSGCACNLSIAPNVAGKPIIYAVDVRGYSGNWKSSDGGTNWTLITVSPAPPGRQDFGWISVDPYDANHLMITGHEQDTLFQSTDAGASWTGGIFPAGALGSGGTAGFAFVDTGSSASTRNTWLWVAQAAGGTFGTWRTTDGGTSWIRVDNNEKPHGGFQVYQPDTGGVLYMPGLYSALGHGVLRSSDYGKTWAHVGLTAPESVVFGTPNNVYAQYGWACQFCSIDPNNELAAQPGSSGWSSSAIPGMGMGADEAAVSWNGTSFVAVTANWNSGIWRSVESRSGGPPPTATIKSTSTTVAAPTLTSTPITGNAVPHVQGAQIVAGGKVIQYRGVNRSGSEYACLGGWAVFDGPSDQASVTAMKSWAVNAVRIPLNEDCWLGINGAPGGGMTTATYRAGIVAYATLLKDNGIAPILDLQWSAPGTTVSNALAPMPDRDHAPKFWTSVANSFKTNTLAIFDLYNEPYPDNNSNSVAAWRCLRDGGTCPGVPYTAAGTQELLTAVRATGATNMVMVPGVQYTNTLDQWLTYKPIDSRNNLIASWHSYAEQICITQACWDTQLGPVVAKVPLITGEIGEKDCAHGYIDTLMPWLDKKGAGYLGWAWDAYDCSGFPSLISSYDGTPTSFGIGLRDHLLGSGDLPTPTPTVAVVPTLTSTPVAIRTPTSTPISTPTGTPTSTATECQVITFVNGVQTLFNRPLTFCTNQ